MGYIFYKIILLNGKKKSVYNKKNSIKLYCKLNSKMIDIKKYKELCKKPKVKKTIKRKSKKDKEVVKKRVKKRGGGIFNNFFNWFSSSGKTQDEKDLINAEAKYDEIHNIAEKKCGEERDKAIEVSNEVQRLKLKIEQTKIEKNKIEKNNVENINFESSTNTNNNLRDVSTTSIYQNQKDPSQIGGKLKKSKKSKKSKKGKKVKK